MTYVIAREDWGHGPWDNEPDREQWTDPATGLVCLARRGPSGNWCGYVGVPDGHPAHGKDYDDVDVKVHGGLTYSDHCDGDPVDGICHVPEDGQPDHLYWLGFDCAHAWDLMPRYGREFSGLLSTPPVYRTLAYVREECTNLAAQLSVMGSHPTE